MRFIRLDENNTVTSIRFGKEILNDEIQSEKGELGQIMQSDGTFIDDDVSTFDKIKEFKVTELKTMCQEDIQNGFVATNTHTYRTNSDDQLNFLGKFNQLISDTSILKVMWKTEDLGYFEHTRDEWLTVYNEALTAKEQKLFKYDQLKQQVERCTTKEEVEAIVW